MTIHKQRRGSGYGWYYAGFAFAAFGLGALVVLLATGDASVELTPWRPIAYLIAMAVIAGVLKLRAARRGR